LIINLDRMARSVNRVILIGNLGKDPEVRHLESGAVVANFSLATSESYKDRNSGEVITNTDWHNIVVWRGLAEVAEKYAKKGDKIYIEGKLKSRSYQDQDGVTKYITEVLADNLVLLGKQDSNPSSVNPADVANNVTSSAPKTAANPYTGESDDDDLPF
jgi:single-strand DNA-binding protein